MDEDILKTLENIEKILKSASVLGGRSTIGSSAQRAKEALKARFQKNEDKTYKAVAASVKDLDAGVVALDKSMKGLNSEVGKTTSTFSALNSHMAKFMSSIQPGTGAAGVAQNIPGPGGATGAKNTQQFFTAVANGNPVFNKMVQNFMTAGGVASAFGVKMEMLGRAVKQITTDMFSLARVGLGTTDSMLMLYKNSILSGMSLEAYTGIIKENMVFASRAGDLSRFDEVTSTATKQLAVLGVFGAEAKALQASLANSLTVMGASQMTLTDEIGKQVSVFERLRASTNMTAQEFQGLVKSVADSENAQRELVGLSPEERNARIQQLMAINTTGQRLGLAAEQSQRLATAMMDARKETVKNRFESAGRIRQLGAFTGMTAEAERVAQITMKGRRATDAEAEEARVLLGRIDAASQSFFETGNLGAENVIEQLQEKLGGLAIGRVMDANRPAELAQQSATVFNQDFGKSVGAFGQFVGQLLALGQGAMSSPIGGLLAGLGGGLLIAFRTTIFGALTKAISAGSVAAAAAAKPMAAFSGLMSGFGGALIKMAPLLARAIAPLTAIGELITGSLSSALNPEGGAIARIGGMITAFLAAIPNLAIDVVTFFFGEKMVQPIQRAFDIFLAYMNMAVKDLLAGIINIPRQLLSWLPEDSGLLRMLNAARDGLMDSAAQNASAVEQMWNDQSLTLEKIGDRNRKAAEGSTRETARTSIGLQAAQDELNRARSSGDAAFKAATAQQARALNSVQFGQAITPDQVLRDARAFAATPQIQVPAPVAPPETVNTSTAQQTTNTGAVADAEMISLLKAMLTTLTRSATAEELQAELAAMQLEQSKPRAGFSTAEDRANRLLKNMRGLA